MKVTFIVTFLVEATGREIIIDARQHIYPAGDNGAIYWDYGVDVDNTVVLVINFADQKLHSNYRDKDGDDVIVSGQGSAVNDGVWHHVAWIRNAITSAKLYLDGVEIGSDSNASMDTITLDDGAKPMIGRYPTALDEFFNGIIDEVRVYNRALSPDEVEALADNSVTIEAGETAYMTHTCDGVCWYSIILDASAREASLEC
ncbi:MAG: LamG domain-containing protein [Planctomycetes bacterium]|nr:LamG domain-containing protein [Planctomycetota bacterium]